MGEDRVEYVSHFGMVCRNLKIELEPWRVHVSAEPIEAPELDVYGPDGEFIGRCPVENDEHGAWVVLHSVMRSPAEEK